MIYKKIDGVNYVRQTIPSANGPLTVEGITVRGLRKAIEGFDPDAMVVYAAEQGDGLLFGCIGGAVLTDGEAPACLLVGPEACGPLKALIESMEKPREGTPIGPDDILNGDEQMGRSTGEAVPPPVDRSKVDTTDGKPLNQSPEDEGQHANYLVLSAEERAKGWVRPYRDKYIHTTCGVETVMGRALSETYARDPEFYGSTYCCGCKAHFPVEQFRWAADNQVVGS